MLAKRFAIVICLAVGLTTGFLLGAEVISNDDYGSYAVGHDEPAEDAPRVPGKVSATEPGMIGAMFDGPWQAPQQAPTMMECVTGACEECCCPRGGWVGGAGVYVIKPHWTTNPAFATTVTSGAVNIDSQTDFPYSYYATPLVWFGYVGENGLGARTRFWLFDQSSTLTRTNDGNVTYISAAPLNYLNSSSTAGDSLTFTSGLDVDVVDFELTQTFQVGAFTGQLSAGGRYTRIQQSYHHVETPQSGLDDIVDSSHSFDGFGPSLGAEVKRSLLNSGFSLYANGRGSLLFGKSSQQATNINNSAITNIGSFSNWDVMPTMETELGILWERDTDRGRLFLDAGVVGIAFFGAGNAANNQILLNSTDDQADKNATLGFFGFKFAAGMSY
ncbi:MAG: Lpg1974 family pore-forming outer membrane protein [Pirellulaceae bacterium]